MKMKNRLWEWQGLARDTEAGREGALGRVGSGASGEDSRRRKGDTMRPGVEMGALTARPGLGILRASRGMGQTWGSGPEGWADGWKQGSCPPENQRSGISRASRGCKELSWLPASGLPGSPVRGQGARFQGRVRASHPPTLGSGAGGLSLHLRVQVPDGPARQRVQLNSGPWRRALALAEGEAWLGVRGEGLGRTGPSSPGGTVPALTLGTGIVPVGVSYLEGAPLPVHASGFCNGAKTHITEACVLVTQSCPPPCDPIDYSLPAPLSIGFSR